MPSGPGGLLISLFSMTTRSIIFFSGSYSWIFLQDLLSGYSAGKLALDPNVSIA